MAGAPDGGHALDGIDLNTVAFVVCLAVFLGGAVTLALGVEYGLLLLFFGLGGLAVFKPSAMATDISNENETEREDAERNPLSILRERYARGELTDEEFEHRLDRLLETEPDDSAHERANREPITERS